jgi:crossover junction endodeoxyribonuclease RuvC
MLRTARMLLGATARLSDEADAIALAVCHLARRVARLAIAAGGPPAVPSRLRPARRDHRGCR